jgi:hypothetical protein
VCLDPGGDRARWQDFGWIDKGTGRRRSISTTDVVERVLVESLDDKAADWSRPPVSTVTSSVVVREIQTFGRASPVLDADSSGEPGDLLSQRARYRLCACGCGNEVAPGRRYVDGEHRSEAARRRRRRAPAEEVLCACRCGTAFVPRRKDHRFLNDAHGKRARRAL